MAVYTDLEGMDSNGVFRSNNSTPQHIKTITLSAKTYVKVKTGTKYNKTKKVYENVTGYKTVEHKIGYYYDPLRKRHFYKYGSTKDAKDTYKQLKLKDFKNHFVNAQSSQGYTSSNFLSILNDRNHFVSDPLTEDSFINGIRLYVNDAFCIPATGFKFNFDVVDFKGLTSDGGKLTIKIKDVYAKFANDTGYVSGSPLRESYTKSFQYYLKLQKVPSADPDIYTTTVKSYTGTVKNGIKLTFTIDPNEYYKANKLILVIQPYPEYFKNQKTYSEDKPRSFYRYYNINKHTASTTSLKKEDRSSDTISNPYAKYDANTGAILPSPYISATPIKTEVENADGSKSYKETGVKFSWSPLNKIANEKEYPYLAGYRYVIRTWNGTDYINGQHDWKREPETGYYYTTGTEVTHDLLDSYKAVRIKLFPYAKEVSPDKATEYKYTPWKVDDSDPGQRTYTAADYVEKVQAPDADITVERKGYSIFAKVDGTSYENRKKYKVIFGLEKYSNNLQKTYLENIYSNNTVSFGDSTTVSITYNPYEANNFDPDCVYRVTAKVTSSDGNIIEGNVKYSDYISFKPSVPDAPSVSMIYTDNVPYIRLTFGNIVPDNLDYNGIRVNVFSMDEHENMTACTYVDYDINNIAGTNVIRDIRVSSGRYRLQIASFLKSPNGKYYAYSETLENIDIKSKPTIPPVIRQIQQVASLKDPDSTKIMLKFVLQINGEEDIVDSYEVQYVTESADYFNSGSKISTVEVSKSNLSIEDGELYFYALELDKTTSDEYFFRIRTKNDGSGDGYSPFSQISSIKIGIKPDAPSIWTLLSSYMAPSGINFYLVHNTVDGSLPTAVEYKFDILVDGSTVTKTETIDINNLPDNVSINKNNVSLKLNTDYFSDSEEITWSARTKGFIDEWSDYSETKTISIYEKPEINLYVVDSGSYPVDFNIYVTAKNQSVIGYNFSIRANETYSTYSNSGEDAEILNGTEIYGKYTNGTVELNGLTISLYPDDVNIVSGISYTATFTVAMDSGITVEESTTFSVTFQNAADIPVPYAYVNLYEGITVYATIQPFCSKILENYQYHLVNYNEIDNYFYEPIMEGDETNIHSGSEIDGIIETESYLKSLNKRIGYQEVVENEDGTFTDAHNDYSWQPREPLELVKMEGMYTTDGRQIYYGEFQNEWIGIGDVHKMLCYKVENYDPYSIVEPISIVHIPGAKIAYRVDRPTIDGEYYYNWYYNTREILNLTNIFSDPFADISEATDKYVKSIRGADEGSPLNVRSYTDEDGTTKYYVLDEYAPAYSTNFSYQEDIPNVEMSVYRYEYDGSLTCIGTHINSNDVLTDMHCSLDYARYRIVAKSTINGEISVKDLDAIPVSRSYIIVEWDERWSNFFDSSDQDIYYNQFNELVDTAYYNEEITNKSYLKLPYNISVSSEYGPDVEYIEYSGRKHPVSYYGTQRGETSSMTVSIPKTDKARVYALRRLANYMGNVYIREPYGSGYTAHVEVSFDQSYDSMVIPVTLNVTRVEDDE